MRSVGCTIRGACKHNVHPRAGGERERQQLMQLGADIELAWSPQNRRRDRCYRRRQASTATAPSLRTMISSRAVRHRAQGASSSPADTASKWGRRFKIELKLALFALVLLGL
jgi:hypothetical protein